MTSRTVKQESSIPVQTRVSIVSLAELAKYWEGTEYNIRTMSQLVSWSLDLLRDVLKANDMIIAEDEVESVVEARDYLVSNGLWQSKVSDRAFAKLGTAIRFENFRGEGQNPQTRDEMSRKGYNIMHNKHSVEPYEDKVGARRKQVQEVVETYHEIEKLSQEEVRAKYFKEQAKKEKEMKEYREEEKLDGEPTVKEGMTDEEWEAKQREIAKRDEERAKLENAPFDASDLPIVGDENDK